MISGRQIFLDAASNTENFEFFSLNWRNFKFIGQKIPKQTPGYFEWAARIDPERTLIDPGIGFGKRRRDNLDLLRGLDELVALGYPVVLGASRKRFMGRFCQETDPLELLGATIATTALGTAAGVRIFRVHDVKPNRQAVDVAWALGKSR